MSGEKIIRIANDRTNRFFYSKNDQINNMFMGYASNPKILEMSSGFQIPKNMSFQQVQLGKKLIERLSIFNDIKEGDISFDFNKGNNFIYGLFPEATSDPQLQNTTLKGKKYKGIIRHGVDNYMLVDVTLTNQKGQLQISDMNITSDIFKSPNAVSKFLPNNKIIEDVYTMTPDGLIKVQNHDYYNIVDRYMRYNHAINEGSVFVNSDLLTMSMNITSQSSSANAVTNNMNATGIQTMEGIANGSSNSSVISNRAYISGKSLNEILIENTTETEIKNDLLYKINFDQSTNRVVSVEEYLSAGVKNEDFFGNDLIKNQNLTKERVMDFVGTENSKLRHLLTPQEVMDYNKELLRLNNNGILNPQSANALAERVIREQQIKTLNNYGFNKYLEAMLGIKDISGEDYIKEYDKYYNSLETPTIQEIDLYNYIHNHLDKNVISARILHGQMFDDYLDVAKQSANIGGKVRYVSQSEFTPFGYMNTDLQRKAQAANKFDKLSLTTSEGVVFEPSDIAREIFANSIKEFEYKKTKFNYVQGKAIRDLTDQRAGVVPNPTSSLYKSQAKILYADTPLAFQDSDLFTNSFSLQNISMYNNKKPMKISYSSLTKNVFGDASSEEIQNFLEELQNKNYDFNALSDSNIKNNFIKNLLGEDAYSKYIAYRQAGNKVMSEYEDAFNPLKKIKSISNNRNKFATASSEVVGNINNWFNKYAIRSNGEALVNILNPSAVEAGQNINVSGSNYNIIENVRFTKEGIELDLKHILLQSGGTKVMLDNVKATTQGLTDIIEVKSGNFSHFVEGIINEKMTKGSRGFTGTFFARSLYTMASNSLYADYKNDVTEINDKFNLFKKTLSDTKFAFGSDGKQINIFELLNVDLEYDNGTIYFKDLNVQNALDSKIVNSKGKVSAKEFLSGVSLDARIKNAMNENLKKLYGRGLTVDESKTIGVFASELLYTAYDNLLKKMTKNSSAQNQVRIKNPAIYKSYIAGDKIGMALASDKYPNNSLNEYAYLFNADIYQMEETKKRAIEEGLKVGRLTGLTLSEIGFNDLVDVIKNKASFELTDVLRGYLMLTADPETDFARGTEKFKAFFNNVIDISDDNLVYNKIGMNISIQDYLKDSPLGRLMKFNVEKGKLEEVSKGIIKGFDNKYISDLNRFFTSENAFRDISILAGTSIFESDFNLNKNSLKELNLKKEVFASLKTKVKESSMNASLKDFFKEKNTISLMGNKNLTSDEIVEKLYFNYRNFLYGKLNNIADLTDNEKNIINMLNKNNASDTGLNFFKSFLSLMEARSFSNEGKRIIYRDDIRESISNFDINKSSLNSLIKFYSNNNLIENRGVITSFYNNINNIKGINMEANLLDLREIARFNSIPYIIDSLSVDAVGKIVPNQTINKLEKIIKTNMELKELYKLQSFLEVRENVSNYSKINNASVEGKQLREAFKQFMERHENVNFDKKRLTNSMQDLFRNVLISDITINSFDNRSVYNLMMMTDKKNEEVREKLSKYIFDIKNSKTATTLNSNFVTLLNKNNISDSIISNAVMQIINKQDERYLIDIDSFIKTIESLEENYKQSENGEEIYNNIHKFKNDVIDLIGETYKEQIVGNFFGVDDFINQLNQSNLTSGSDVEKMILGMIGKYRKSSADLKRRMVSANNSDSNFVKNQILKKQGILTSIIMDRNSHLGETILTKGGIIYDATSTKIANSAAISPREGSAITNFIRTEMYDVLKNRKIVDGSVVEGEDYKDLKRALRLIYGDYLVDGELAQFDNLYMSTEKLSRAKIKDSVNEIKRKLDDYSHIVIGDEKMFTLNGQISMFRKGNQVAFGMLSRHPHQYKMSVTPTRYVLLTEEDKALSFIGKYIGTGNTVDGTQSSLYTIGKKTALGAKGDFDGDIFQIMFLGDKDLDYMKYEKMNPKDFLKKYNKKLELYNLLINSTSDNLESVFGADPNNTSLFNFQNKKYNRIKKLVKDLYFDENHNLTNQEVYNVIKKPYLSLVHENVRVLKMLSDETEEHANLPEVLGEISINKKKISRRSLTELLLTLPDEIRNRYLLGDYDHYDIETVIRNNSRISDFAKTEFNSILDSSKNNSGKQFIIDAINYLRDKDPNALAWQMLHRHVNKYKDDIGLYKTPNVHTKLTNFRNAMDAMKSEETFAKAKAYLEILKEHGAKEEMFFDINTLSIATSSHDIGTLIEKLAISSKKGSVSPDIKLTQFLKGENLIKKNSLNFDYKAIADMVLDMQSALARANSEDGFISKNILDMNFDEWFKSLYKGSQDLTDEIYYNLKRSFLILSDASNIESKINNKDLTIFEMFDGSKNSLYNAVFSTNLSNWTSIMFKGQLERVLKINGDINGNIYKQIFNLSGENNFTYQFKKLWNVLTNPSKYFGTRDEPEIVRKSVSRLLKEKAEQYIADGGDMADVAADNKNIKITVDNVESPSNQTIKEVQEIDNANVLIEEISDNINKIETNVEQIVSPTTPKKKKRLSKKEKEFKEMEQNATKLNFGQEVKTVSDEIKTVEQNISNSIEQQVAENVVEQSEEVNNIPNQPISNSEKIEMVESPSNQTVKEIDSSNESLNEINEVVKNTETEKITSDITSQIEELKRQLKELQDAVNDKNNRIESLGNIIKTKQNEIDKLEQMVKDKDSKIKKVLDDNAVVKKFRKGFEDTATYTKEKFHQATNSDIANAAKKQIKNHKKALTIAGGVLVLSQFFRIFQSNRPVVNLDINEQEYERSQGSLYRNLGQYTMNTNIRELY